MIRKMDITNTADYKRLRLQSLQTDPNSFFSTYEEALRLPDYSFESDLRQASEFGYYGKFDDAGNLIGYISLQLPYFQKQSHFAEIYNLYIDPSQRGKGYAKKLVLHLIDVAQAKGSVETLSLTVMGENKPALALYTSVGFVPYARKERSLKTKDKYIDEIMMRLDL